MNHTFKITVTSPLLRPGLTIETEVSGRYLVHALNDIFDKIREFNTQATTNKET